MKDFFRCTSLLFLLLFVIFNLHQPAHKASAQIPPITIPDIVIPTIPLDILSSHPTPTSAPQPTNSASTPSVGSNSTTTNTTQYYYNTSDKSSSPTTLQDKNSNSSPIGSTGLSNSNGTITLNRANTANGRVVLNKDITEVIFGSDSLSHKGRTLVIVMPSEKDMPIIFDFGAFLKSDGIGTQHMTLPQAIRMEQSSDDEHVSVVLPENEDLTTSSNDCDDAVWDGTVTALTMLSPTQFSLPGKEVDLPIEVGKSDCKVDLSKQASIVFMDKSNLDVGYRLQNQEDSTHIISLCSVKNTTECYLYQGKDLLVRTYHFTQFFTFKDSTFWGNIASLIKNSTAVAIALAAIATLLLALILGNLSILRKVGNIAKVDKEKSEYVSLASHELRTPMTAIKWVISAIMNGTYGPIKNTLKKPLEEINNSTQRSISMVNDMLDVSRIEAGKITLNLSDFSLEALAKEVIASLIPIATEKGLQLEAKTLDTSTVKADKEKTRQIVTNLISNAIKYTPKGNVFVSSKSTKDTTTLLVTDTGIGISKEDQKKLFNKFQRISSSATEKIVGSGLGLYISRQLARRMGGDISLESSSPEGSIFALTLMQANSPTAQKLQQKT